MDDFETQARQFFHDNDRILHGAPTIRVERAVDALADLLRSTHKVGEAAGMEAVADLVTRQFRTNESCGVIGERLRREAGRVRGDEAKERVNA